LGRFGASVARTLSKKNHQVIAIDTNENLVQDISETVTQAVCLDATELNALETVGIKDVDVAVCAIGKDLKASILVTMNLKDLGIKEIVCRAQDEKHGMLLEKIGATKVILPEVDMGVRVANGLMASRVIEHIELSDDSSIAEVIPLKNFIGKSLKEIGIRGMYGLNVIGIKKKVRNVTAKGLVCDSEKINMSPNAEYIIDENDILVVLGANEDIDRFKKENK